MNLSFLLNRKSPDSLTSDDLSMPLVKRIMSDLELELRYYQCSRLHAQLEVVADIVTRLLFIMKTDPKGTPYNGSSMHLTKLAMDIVHAVLGNLSSFCLVTNLQAQYSRPVAARMTRSIHKKLVKCMYTPDDMKAFLSTSNGTLMAAITALVSVKVGKLFQQSWLQSSEPPSILRLFMIASSHRGSPTTGEKLVIHSETVTSVVTLVVLQIHSEEDPEFVFKPHNWPLVDHVVNRLALSGVKVTKKKSLVNCYFNMNELVCMVNSICEHLVTMYDSMDSLLEALSYKNRMVSRDISRMVCGQLEMAGQNRKVATPPVEVPLCHEVENVLCGLVARFIHILVPVTMAEKEDLIMCLLLVDQIRYFTEVIFFQSQEMQSYACHLKELSSDMIDQLGDMVFNQYIESFPLYDVESQLHSLVMDKNQSYMISNMIITTLLNYVRFAGFALCDASPAVKPPPGFALPDASPAVKPPPGFALCDASPIGRAHV